MDLRKHLVRLAHENPELRSKLVPMLREADTALTGKTLENDHIRYHVYRGSIRVFDLTNAGRRGKNVDGFVLYDTDMVSDADLAVKVDQFAFRLKSLDFAKAKRQAEALVAEAEAANSYSPKLKDFSEKGVRVAPAGFGPMSKRTKEFEIDADWDDYSVRDLADKYNEPACYNMGKKDVKRFYRWVKDNWSKISRLTYNELTKLMSSEGFQFRSFCRMD